MKSIPFIADGVAAMRFPVLPASTLAALAASSREDLESIVRQLLANPFIRESIYLASPALYGRICEWEKGGPAYGDIAATVGRYLLRMAYRSTPFGTFSCVSSLKVAPGPTNVEIPDRDRLVRLAQLDSAALTRLASRVAADPAIKPRLRYALNDTISINSDVVALTAYDRNRKMKRVYRKVELERDPYIDAVLDIAQMPKTVAQIAEELCLQHPADSTHESATEFVWQLVDAQVLCADNLVELTEFDSLKALVDQIGGTSALGDAISALRHDIQRLQGSDPIDPSTSYLPIVAALNALRVRTERDAAVKVDLVSPNPGTQILGKDVVRRLERSVNALAIITKKKAKLSDFIKIFVEAYGDSEVPLSMVADRLESLGFSDREASQPALSRALREASRRPHDATISLSDEILVYMLARTGDRYCDITRMADNAVRSSGHDGVQDSTLVAWLSLWRSGASDPVLEIRGLGSQEPGRVMGRFAFGLPELSDYLSDTCESAPHPVVEIIHQPEDRLGNICGRPPLSPYEFRLRAGPAKDGIQLTLDDLSVSVVRERVVVRSAKLGGPISLRMSNAHAFDRVDNLSIYRFLNIVSNQDYTAEMVSPAKRLTSASFVPGLKCDGVIIARPFWRLFKHELQNLKSGGAEARLAFRRLAVERDMPDWIALVQGENSIPYNINADWMLDDLIRQALKAGYAVLTDVYPEGMTPCVQSPKGEHFHEIQIALRAIRPRSRAEGDVPHKLATSTVSNIWSEWAYLKLYVTPQHQATVLQETRPHVERLIEGGQLDGYFFVRYKDDLGTQIRLRLRSRNSSPAFLTVGALSAVLEDLSRRGLIGRVELEPYVREVSRYGGPERLSVCEDIFLFDSRCVIDALALVTPYALDFWRQGAVAVDCMMQSLCIGGLDHRLAFARRAATEFAHEFSFGSRERKQMGEIFKATGALRFSASGEADLSQIPGAQAFLSGNRLIADAWQRFLLAGPALSPERRYNVQWSLIHMRLNRLLERDQRMQEAVIWELLKRSYAAALNRQSSSAALPSTTTCD